MRLGTRQYINRRVSVNLLTSPQRCRNATSKYFDHRQLHLRSPINTTLAIDVFTTIKSYSLLAIFPRRVVIVIIWFFVDLTFVLHPPNVGLAFAKIDRSVATHNSRPDKMASPSKDGVGPIGSDMIKAWEERTVKYVLLASITSISPAQLVDFH